MEISKEFLCKFQQALLKEYNEHVEIYNSLTDFEELIEERNNVAYIDGELTAISALIEVLDDDNYVIGRIDNYFKEYLNED